jgi:RNA polymerase sigma factor (sigma-70 family)
MGRNHASGKPPAEPVSVERLPQASIVRRSLWAEVFSCREGWLLGYFQKRLARPADARDLVQEVYLRLLHVEHGDGSSITDPEAYLFTVASNLVKEEAVLHRRGTLHVDVSQVFPEIEANEDTAEDLVDRQIREQRLADAVSRLPPRHRAVILMQYREHLSYADIARRMNVSTHMVKKYVVQALAACRQELANLR